MSLAEGVLEAILDAARQQEVQRITAVWLEIGRLSSVEPESMAFCFDVVVRGSIAEGARLEIIDVPGQGWCMQCSEAIPLNEVYGECPRCGGYQVQVTGGTEMRIKEIEVS